MSALGFIVCVLATGQIVETWRHGSLFAARRGKLELSDKWHARLLSCPFCFSHWVAGCCVLGMLILERPGEDISLPSGMLTILLWTAAVTRASQLVNDLTHRFCRTPRTGGVTMDLNEIPLNLGPAE